MPENWKYSPYRNKKILALAKGEACQYCGKNDGTTVSAHSNLQAHGKGVGKKSDDCFVAYLCDECHANYDSKKIGGDGLTHYLKLGQEDFERSMHKTMKIWLPKIMGEK